jgi:hypothetical protein
MALKVYQNDFVIPTSTDSSYSITGVGFEPKLVIFHPSWANVEYTGVNQSLYGWGAIDGTNQWYIGHGVAPNQASTQVAYTRHTGRCIVITTQSGTNAEASFVSMDSDGFTLNFSKVDTQAGNWVHFVAYGGGAAEFEIGTTTLAASTTGTKDITTAFDPKGYYLLGVNESSADTLSTRGDIQWSCGAATGSSEHFVVSGFNEDAVARTDTGHGMYTNRVVSFQDAGNSSYIDAAHSSLGTLKFTINVGTAPSSATTLCWIAFGGDGLDCLAGTFTPTLRDADSPSDESFTIETGFQPDSLFIHFSDIQTANTDINDWRTSLGVVSKMTGYDHRHYTVSNFENDNEADSTPWIKTWEGDGTEFNTLVGISAEAQTGGRAWGIRAVVKTFDANGFTLGWPLVPLVGYDYPDNDYIEPFFALKALPTPSLLSPTRTRRMASHLAR